MCVDKDPHALDSFAALQQMVEAVRGGDVARYLPFDREGRAVRLG